MASFGMMNQAYFVGKNILIDWINNFLEIHIEKVEQMANGANYCNLWDAIHPGTIPMSRVDFTARQEYEFTKNWKLLQNGFQKAGIEKQIPVQRLIKARYQDNLEFLQWMYKYARDTYNGDPDEPTYDARGRRCKSKGGRDYTGSSSASSNARPPRPRRTNSHGKENRSTARPTSAAMQRQSKGRSSDRQSANSNVEMEQLRSENKQLRADYEGVKTKLDGVQAEHEEMSAIAKDIEKERDFYFAKVVAIENILKSEGDQDTPLLKGLYELLYQTEEDQQQKQAQEQQAQAQQEQGLQQQEMSQDCDVDEANGVC